jgi:hypothetical protein
VKDVTSNEHQLGTQLDDAVDHPPQRQRDIRLALVDASRGLSLILSEAEMNV